MTVAGNTFVYMHSTSTKGVRADIAIGSGVEWDNVHVMVGGTGFLDIVQIGVRMTATGPRIFAANGHGNPNEPGSDYREWDLGPTSHGWHTAVVVWDGAHWRLDFNNERKLTLDKQAWAVRSSRVVAESESPATRLGGTGAYPMRARNARERRLGAWRLPATGSNGRNSWNVGGYAVPAATRYTFGVDFLNVVSGGS